MASAAKNTKKETQPTNTDATLTEALASIKKMVINAYVAKFFAANEAVRPVWEAALAKAKTPVKKKEKSKSSVKATAIARAIRDGDFGCRRQDVARLMGVAMGIPVFNAYKELIATNTPTDTSVESKPGYVNISGRLGGVILVNIKTKKMVMMFARDSTYFANTDGEGAQSTHYSKWCNATEVRLATVAEIRSFVEAGYTNYFSHHDTMTRYIPDLAKKFRH